MMSVMPERLFARLDTFFAERPAGADEDVHMLASLVDEVIERYSPERGIVLDPFVGFGTTLERATLLGRRGVGVELLPERVALVQQRVPGARVIEGDAREVLRLVQRVDRGLIGAVDLVLTSPPFMTRNEHEADPLTAYERDGGDYDRYLRELELVVAQCARLVKPGGMVVWNVADIHFRGQTTELIADLQGLLAQHLELVGVTEVVWDEYPHDLVADAILVFRRGA